MKNKAFSKFVSLTTYSCSKAIIYIRKKFLCHLLKSAGEKCDIKSGVIIDYPENISIGNSVSIQNLCFISGYGGVTIGNDVSLGNNTRIFSSEHPYLNSKQPFKYNELAKCPVVIGNNVITGSGTIILGNVHIGDNVMIGAGAVVTKNIPSNVVVVGNPAKVIKCI